MHAVRDERVDEIIVSTFPERAAPAGCAATSSGGCAGDGCRSSTSSSSPSRSERRVSAHAEHAERTRTTITARRSRTRARGSSATVLGMFLFIASEAMLFGSFFTAYFFVRVVNPDASRGRSPPFELPVFVAGVNTAILVTSSFTMHWALQSIKRGNRAGLKAGLVLTFLLGLTFLLTQMLEYARVGFNPSDGAFGTIFFGLTGLHGAHVFVGLTLLAWRRSAHSAATSRPSTTTASRSPGSTGTSST